ncbi:MAG: hypothetical protein M1421_05435 [Candidatus Eremiobacteraeota bacterium]|nr:hypothetical protein [Candidatus Eremiobacteraeota bacterium]MCL5056060.1 hypothetical protein [Bacillota bacterium]
MKKVIISFLSLILGAVIFAGCRSIPPPAGSGIPTGPSSSSSSSSSTQSNLNSVSISMDGRFAASVGDNGTILSAANSASSNGSVFPSSAWTLISPSPTQNNLTSISFDESGTSDTYALAVGDNGTILENSNSGGSGWVLGSINSSTNPLVVTDSGSGCSPNPNGQLSTFTTNLNGAAVFTQNAGEPAVIVGSTITDGNCPSKGLIAVATSGISSSGNLPFNNFNILDTYGPTNTPIPDITFNGVSFTQGSSSVPIAVVVGDNSTILVGNSNLSQGSNWQLDTPPNTSSTLNSVAVSSNNEDAAAVGINTSGNSVIFGTNNLQSAVPTWQKIPISSSISQSSTLTSVFFVHSNAAQPTAIAVGQNPPEILEIVSCCSSTSTITNITPSNITGGLLNLTGVWVAASGTTQVVLSSGASGLIIESDTGGTSWNSTPDHQ